MKAEQLNAIAVRLADAHFTKVRKKYMDRCIKLITMAFAITLADKLNWTTEEINSLNAQVEAQFVLLHEKYVNIDDIEKWAKESGVNL